LDKWKTQGVYARIKLLEHLPRKYTCVVFDRRESAGQAAASSVSLWAHYVAQGRDCWIT